VDFLKGEFSLDPSSYSYSVTNPFGMDPKNNSLPRRGTPTIDDRPGLPPSGGALPHGGFVISQVKIIFAREFYFEWPVPFDLGLNIKELTFDGGTDRKIDLSGGGLLTSTVFVRRCYPS